MNQNNEQKHIAEGYVFSNLSDEDLKALSKAEQLINEHHGTKSYLIAYDKAEKPQKL